MLNLDDCQSALQALWGAIIEIQIVPELVPLLGSAAPEVTLISQATCATGFLRLPLLIMEACMPNPLHSKQAESWNISPALCTGHGMAQPA